MRKFLEDSYNGLYVVLLKPYMPSRKTILMLVLGVLLGLVWGYGVSPNVYYDADPSTLHQSFQDEWVKLIADRNAATNMDIGATIVDLLRRIDDPLGTVDRLINTPGEEANRAKLEAIRGFAEAAQPLAARAPEPSLVANILPFIIAPLIVAVVAVIIALLWGLLIRENVVVPVQKRMRGEKESSETASMRQAVQAARTAEATLKSNFSDTSYGTPLMQRMSTYILGHGQYDDSFSIEDEQERFLGECGAGISEFIGVGDPRRVTAVEVWLFDKDDFVRTVTKVFVSEHAFNDPALRAKLEPKGDLVLIQPGAVAVLETNSLRLQARIVDVSYGTGPLPPNSYFDKLTIELAAWRKQPAAAGVAAPAVPAAVSAPQVAAPQQAAYFPPQSVPAAPQIQRPATPSPSVPQTAPGQYGAPPARPASPPTQPPSGPPGGLDDDPFGGTGDFTPIR